MAAFHTGQAAYRALGETDAEARQKAAATAHRTAATAPMDKALGGAAMRAGGIADAASQRAIKDRR